MPPNCVAFVAVVALVALVAFVAVSADEAFALRIAYGVEVTCWRGVSKVNEPPVGRALIAAPVWDALMFLLTTLCPPPRLSAHRCAGCDPGRPRRAGFEFSGGPSNPCRST